MKLRFALAALMLSALVAVQSLRAADKELGKDVKCPVSGKAVKAASSVEFNGGKVYFCCDGCPGAFKKDTAKFAGKANMQLVQTGQLEQVACPLTGKPINPATAVDVSGVKVAFCCNGCKGKVEKASGDEQIDMVFKDTSKGFKAAAAK